MSKLAEKIQWYSSVEERKWKRIYHCIEILFIALAGIVAAGVLLAYGSGEGFELVVLLFVACLAVASLLIIPAMYRQNFKRWHIFSITLGFGSGMGLAIAASFLVLELQQLNA